MPEIPEHTKRDEVHRRIDGFNEVDAWITPAGELVISLSHGNTNEYDVLVRVRTDEDVILVDETTNEYSGDNIDGPWEDETVQLGRLNKGGNWDA